MIVALLDEWSEVIPLFTLNFPSFATFMERYLSTLSYLLSQITAQIAAGNSTFFKDKLCDEGQKKDEEGGGVVLALAPWVTRLPPAMRLPFDAWALSKVFDMRACYAAFFLGSGCINDRLVKMRRLMFGHVFTCCRSRLVAYLVPRAPARQRICALAASAAPTVSSSAAAESLEEHKNKYPRHEY